MLLAVLFGIPGFAAEGSPNPVKQPSPPSPFSNELLLKDLLQQALDQNPALRSAKYDALSKEAAISPAGSWDDPMVGFEAMNYPVDTYNPREFGMTGNQLSLTQRIPFPGKLSQLSKAAEQEHEARRNVYSARQLELIRQVKAAFYELFVAQRRKEILNERQSLIRQLISATRNKYSVGKAQQAELLNLQLEEANVIGQLLSADRQLEAIRANLATLVSREPQSLQGEVRAVERTTTDLSKLSEKNLTELILSRNPMLKTAHAELGVSEARLSYARWNYLPDFEFRVGYTFRQPSPGDRGVDFLSGAVTMSVPLWTLTKQAQSVKSASADRIRAEASVEQQRNELLRAIHIGYAELEESERKLQLFETGLLPLARQSVQTGKSAFLAGKLEYASLLNLINARFQTELDYHETLALHETRVADFEALLGEPLSVALVKAGESSSKESPKKGGAE